MTGQSVSALKQLSSAISRGAMVLVRQPATAGLGRFQSANISYAGCQSVKKEKQTLPALSDKKNLFYGQNKWVSRDKMHFVTKCHMKQG